MARIVLTSWGSYGDVNPYIGLGLALRARGHHPVLACNSYYRDAVEREGLGFHPIPPDIGPDDTRVVEQIMHPRRGPEILLRSIIVPAVRVLYAALAEATRGADLMVSHPLSFAAPLLAERTGIPWVSTVLAPMSFFSRYDLPVFPAAPGLKRAERLGPWVGRLFVALSRWATRRWTTPVLQLRHDLGLGASTRHPLFEGQHSPARVLALFPRVLAAPQPDWPPNVIVTGQIGYNGAHGERLSTELERFLDAGAPPVVFTLGSSAIHVAGDFYEESISAVRRLAERAVLLAGHEGVTRLRDRAPANILVADSAPHSLLFPRASVIVQQCGIGTLGQALRSGRPILCVPFAHDQPDNAHRAERLGVARTLVPARYSADRVVGELNALLKGSQYAEAASRIAQEVRAEPGVVAACDAIEEELKRRR